MRVFISHSSVDVDVAKLLIEVLRKAYNLAVIRSAVRA